MGQLFLLRRFETQRGFAGFAPFPSSCFLTNSSSYTGSRWHNKWLKERFSESGRVYTPIMHQVLCLFRTIDESESYFALNRCKVATECLLRLIYCPFPGILKPIRPLSIFVRMAPAHGRYWACHPETHPKPSLRRLVSCPISSFIRFLNVPGYS